jgi:serine/threonine kinase PknH
VWTTAQVSNATGTLAISLVLGGVRHWTCPHALTVANNVAVDVQACGYNQTAPAAVAIVGQIAAKVADR